MMFCSFVFQCILPIDIEREGIMFWSFVFQCILPIDIEGEGMMFCSGGEHLYLWSEQCELLDKIIGDEETKDGRVV